MKGKYILMILTAVYTFSGAWSNIFLNPEICKYIEILQEFTADVPATALPFTPVVSSPVIRAHGLKNDNMACFYLVNKGDHTAAIIGQTVTLDTVDKGNGYWYDPITGDTLSTFSVEPGASNIPIPDFFIDMAGKIKYAGNINIETMQSLPGIRADVFPNPFNSAVVISLHGMVAPLPATALRIAIYDIHGRMIDNLTSHTGYLTWRPSGLAKGLYIIKVRSAKHIFSKKVLLR